MKEENMGEFNFKSSVCTSIEQSERLLALGLKKETADFYTPIKLNPDKGSLPCPPDFWTSDEPFIKKIREASIPAWSLYRLIEMIQDVCCRIAMVYSWVRIENPCMPCVDYSYDSFNDTYDNLIGCIAYLIKEGYFPKEYLV